MDEAKDPRAALGELIKSLTPDQTVKLVEAYLGLAEPRIESAISKSLPTAIDQALRRVGYTEEIGGLLHFLAARSNGSKEDVIRRALNLYKFALDAREEGNRVAILNPEDEIIHEVIGLESAAEPEPSRMAAG